MGRWTPSRPHRATGAGGGAGARDDHRRRWAPGKGGRRGRSSASVLLQALEVVRPAPGVGGVLELHTMQMPGSFHS